MILNINKMEAELLRDALDVWAAALGRENAYPGHQMAARFTNRRIDELRAKIAALIDPEPPATGATP